MYSLNGTALNNPSYGWRLRTPTKRLAALSRTITNLQTPGRDGTVSVDATFDAPTLTFVVNTPPENLEILHWLLYSSSRYPVLAYTADASRNVPVQIVSSDPSELAPLLADGTIDVTFVVKLNDVFWRDAATTTEQKGFGSALNLEWDDLMPGSTAPIRDAVFRAKGPFNSFRLRTYLGSETVGDITYNGAVSSGQYLRIDPAAGSANLGSDDTWSGGTDVTGNLAVSTPDARASLLTVWPRLNDDGQLAGYFTADRTSTGAGAQLAVMARGAYLIA